MPPRFNLRVARRSAPTGGRSHEVLTSFRPVTAASNRKFGLVIGAVLCLVALVPLVHGHPVRVWALIAGLAVLGLGLARPALLGPANRLWFRFGLLLGRITNPLVMGVLFFGVVVPIGWLIRRRGHDLLGLRRDPAAASYWINRDAASGRTQLAKQF